MKAVVFLCLIEPGILWQKIAEHVRAKSREVFSREVFSANIFGAKQQKFTIGVLVIT